MTHHPLPSPCVCGEGWGWDEGDGGSRVGAHKGEGLKRYMDVGVACVGVVCGWRQRRRQNEFFH